ncbi:MAG: hypothetical protein NZ700_16455 [Gemmataceae bacterium]|nr:hypothetical protein [Gemmataceae bacterium]MDW8265232.1 hypothetical protein [Gemmataceae bacterium]
MLSAVIVAAIVLGIIGGALYGIYVLEKKRRQALERAAADLGFDFYPVPPQELLQPFVVFAVHNLGRDTTYANLLHGRAAHMEVSIVDQRFVTGSGKTRRSHSQTVALVCSPALRLPSFTLGPENFLHKLMNLFGYQDIDFADHPRFSRMYLLRGPDEASVRELFTPETLEFFEEHPGLSVEGRGDRFALYRADQRVKPEGIRNFLELGGSILEVLKR